MKNVLKLFIAVLMLGLSINSFAQATFGVKAGLNLSNILMKDNDTKSKEPKVKAGFNFGPTLEIPINNMFSFETALVLSTLGAKFNSDGSSGSYNFMYLDLPLTAKAKFDVGGVQLFGAFGPYLGYAVSGKGKQDGEDDYIIKWGSSKDDDFKPFDAGLHFGAGFGIKAFEIGLDYDLGLANMAIYTDNGYKEANRCLSISVGYKFGKK